MGDSGVLYSPYTALHTQDPYTPYMGLGNPPTGLGSGGPIYPLYGARLHIPLYRAGDVGHPLYWGWAARGDIYPYTEQGTRVTYMSPIYDWGPGAVPIRGRTARGAVSSPYGAGDAQIYVAYRGLVSLTGESGVTPILDSQGFHIAAIWGWGPTGDTHTPIGTWTQPGAIWPLYRVGPQEVPVALHAQGVPIESGMPGHYIRPLYIRGFNYPCIGLDAGGFI